MPELDPEYDDGDPIPLDSVSSMKKSSVAEGNCFNMARSVAKFAYDKRNETAQPVQGLEKYHDGIGMTFHYGNLFTASNGAQMVVDFTFAQLSKKKPFPYIDTPENWVDSINKAVAKKVERNNRW